MEAFEHARLDAYFARINTQFRPPEPPASLLITHPLPERPSFVKAVAAASQLRAILPKPKPINASAQREVEKVAQCATLSRGLFTDPETAVDFLESRAAGEPLVLLDVGGYLAQHPEDKEPLAALLDEAGDTITSRKEFRGHVTAGVVLHRPDGRVLTIEHQALSKWLLPGSHVVEDTDETLVGAALRELAEETGTDADKVTLAVDLPLHVDAHIIPANPAKDEPDHLHFDLRFMFRTTADEIVLQEEEEEVTAASWQFADMLVSEPLRSRVLTTAL
ncbi:NUDIX domain-containing protein [Streptomyces sp. H27-C3]|uniref:NUDIX hydrolase n=1 Tax=Streptomyces sp. H27-C3 TaxID=3046305 RepID=UPI0032D95F3E